MRKSTKTKLLSIAIAVFLFSVAFTAYHFNTGAENNAKLSDDILVTGEGIQIPTERFYAYKTNAEIAASMNQQLNAMQSDEDIINRLIAVELTANFARNEGLSVSSSEIDVMVQVQKDLLSEAETGDPIKALMEKTIAATGLTEEDFWRSGETRSRYETAILISKLNQKLAEDAIEDDASFDMEAFQQELLEKHKDKLIINY
ncbi:SurA N-terminal domain-containing protein [Paenibacillus sp. CAU 1782]